MLAIPLYSNLTVLPKWLGDDEDGDEVDEAALDGLGKRALGQLKAKGVDVGAKMSEWQRANKQAVKEKQAQQAGAKGKGKKRKVEESNGGEEKEDVNMEELMNQ